MYPTDPLVVTPGGIDTFIRGQLKYAPAEIRYSLVGMTADESRSPIGEWQKIQIDGREVRFLPVMKTNASAVSARLPATVRFVAALMRHRMKARQDADILVFHRIEPLILFGKSTTPCTVTLHQNMHDLYQKDGDIAWRHLPGLYFWFERRLLPQADRIFCVRSDATRDYQERFPELSQRISFTPTWADPDVYFPGEQSGRESTRNGLLHRYEWPPETKLIVSVGRLDGQKNPALLLDSFARLAKHDEAIRLLYVGDGPLKDEIAARIGAGCLDTRVALHGIVGPGELSNLLRAADVFALASRYEGMPMAVIEALACGLPVVATRVGEIGRVVLPGRCGELAESGSEDAFSAALERGIRNCERYRGIACQAAVESYTPSAVLEPMHEYFRSCRTRQADSIQSSQ